MHYFQKFTTLAVIAGLLFPFASVYAAPAFSHQKLIDTAVANYSEEGPRMSVISAVVSYEEREKNKKNPKSLFKLSIRSDGRTYPRNITQLDDAIGKISIGDFIYNKEGAVETYTDPLSIDTQIINNTLYVRVSQISDQVIAKLKSEEDSITDEQIQRAVGQWVKFDLTEFVPHLKPQEVGDVRITEAGEIITLTKNLKAIKSPFLVKSARAQQFEGEEVVAARVTLNPKFVAALRQISEKYIKTTNKKERNRQIAEIRTTYASLQKRLAKYAITAYVRPSDATLVGYGLVARESEPLTAYKPVGKTYKRVPIGTKETRVSITISGQPIQDIALVPPASAMTLEEFLKIFESDLS